MNTPSPCSNESPPSIKITPNQRSDNKWLWLNAGLTYDLLGSREDEIRAYDQTVKHLGRANGCLAEELIAKALVSKGIALNQLDRIDEAIRMYDVVVSRFAGRHGQVFREKVAVALYNKGISLGSLERIDEQLAAYEQALDRFDVLDSTDVQVLTYRYWWLKLQ